MPVALALPPPSAQTVMNSRNSAVSKFLEAKQNRRRQTKYRQKRLNMGLPAAVPLKHVSLNQEEKKTIASTEAIGTAKQKKLFVTRHFGWPVSLGIHLFVGFLLTIYAIREYIPEPEPVSLDFVELPSKPRGFIRQPQIRPTKPPERFLVQTQRVQQVQQAIKIPKEEAQLHTLGGDLTPVEEVPGVGSINIPKGPAVQVQQKSVQIVDNAPKVNINRTTSIAPKETDLSDVPDPGLGDRNIDAEVQVQVDQQPRVLRKVDPKYPENARRAEREGLVMAEFLVGVDGRATDIKVIEEEPKGFGFGDAAIDAVNRWRFTPAKKDGESVPMRVKVPVRFTLDDD